MKEQCEHHEDMSQDVREMTRRYGDVLDALGEMVGRIDELLASHNQTQTVVATLKERIDGHVRNLFIHINKWYASAIIIGGVVGAMVTNLTVIK